jgi:hypothetical protein
VSVPLGRADYPRLGPLLATAFDRAVRVTLRSWVWIVALMLAVLAFATLGASQRALDVCLFVWSFAAAANAMRTIDPTYRLDSSSVARLFLVGAGVGIASVFGFVALVWPAVWLGTKWSMAEAAVIADGLPAEVAMRRSWELTTGRFWRTLLFGIVLLLAVEITAGLPALIIGSIAGVLVNTKLIPGTIDQVTNYAIALAVPIAMYASQAQWIAGLYWYRSLKAMQEEELSLLVASPTTA